MNAVILACAKLQQLDRSFATFEETSSLFGLQYDLNSFNALLLACAQDRSPQVCATQWPPHHWHTMTLP